MHSAGLIVGPDFVIVLPGESNIEILRAPVQRVKQDVRQAGIAAAARALAIR